MSENNAAEIFPNVVYHRTCGTCSAFKVNVTNVKQGQCHRNPPVPMVLGVKPGPGGVGMPVIQSIWPPVGANDSCREWESRGR